MIGSMSDTRFRTRASRSTGRERLTCSSLRSPRSPSSLYALTKCQLVGDALRIKSDGQASVKVVSAQVRASAVPPGGNAWGMVALELPTGPKTPTVLKFEFPPDAAGEVTAVLVL